MLLSIFSQTSWQFSSGSLLWIACSFFKFFHRIDLVRILYIAWVKIVLVIVLASSGIYCSQFKQKCCLLKAYWTDNIIESPEGVKSQNQGPVVLPNHTAGLSRQNLTDAQLEPNTSCTTNKPGAWSGHTSCSPPKPRALFQFRVFSACINHWNLGLCPCPTWFLPWRSRNHTMGNSLNIRKSVQNMMGMVNVYLTVLECSRGTGLIEYMYIYKKKFTKENRLTQSQGEVLQ